VGGDKLSGGGGGGAGAGWNAVSSGGGAAKSRTEHADIDNIVESHAAVAAQVRTRRIEIK
jgi:hypothetical protein